MSVSPPRTPVRGFRATVASPSSHTFGSQSPYTTPTRAHGIVPPERGTTGVSIRTTVTTEVLDTQHSTRGNSSLTFAQTSQTGGAQVNSQQYAPAAANPAPPRPKIKVFYIPDPSELVRVTPGRSGKVYVLTKGEDIGIYNDWSDVLARVEAVRDESIYESVSTWEDALAIYTAAYYDGTIERIPVTDGPFDVPYFTVFSNIGRSGVAYINMPAPAPRSTNVPHPDGIQMPTIGKKFYVVLKGEEAGIYGSWHECAVRIRKQRSTHHSVEDWHAAIDIYQKAYHRGLVRSVGRNIPARQMLVPLQNLHYH